MTTLKLGWTNPLTDQFGAHPTFGPVLDLNDGTSFSLVSPEGLELPPPPRTLVAAGNIRTQGERVTRAIYRHNRKAIARLILGPASSGTALTTTIRALLDWLGGPPSIPITLQYQPFNGTAPVYLDVVGCAHAIPADEEQWLRLQMEPIEIVFLARPGLRGDRITLDNLVTNPGFEAPSGPSVQVFGDPFANLNAYALQAGSAPSVAANVMTVPNGTRVTFGSPAWSAVNGWQVRFQWASGMLPAFYLHYTDASNHLRVDMGGGGNSGVGLHQTVGGVDHQLATGSITFTPGNWYWLRFTQFPSVPGDPPYLTASIFNDSGPGSVGGLVVTINAPAFDAVTALSGRPQIATAGAAMNVGGAFGQVHGLWLFGPGGWIFQPVTTGATTTGLTSGAWEADLTKTYPNGPVTSFGAARIDLPPAGTVDSSWRLYTGGAPLGTSAMPAVVGDTVQAAVAVRSSGLSANALLRLVLYEFDASGASLRNTVLQTLTGNQGAWATLSGSLVLFSNTAYVDLGLRVIDTTIAGESANATVWFDNAQCWDQTTTGMATMPYCETRFPQGPAQLLLSGIIGDLPAPAHLALGTFLTSWPLSSTLSFALGRSGKSSANADLVAASNGWYGTVLTPQSTAALDSNSYGGYFAKATVTSGGWNPRAFSPKAGDQPGTYHLLTRFQTAQSAGNLPNVAVRAVTQQRLLSWFGDTGGVDQLGSYFGPFSAPITAPNTWTIVDSGQAVLPPFAAGALTDPTQTYLTPRTQWADATGGGSVCEINWQMLLPIDGSLVMGLLNNPSNAFGAITNTWLWTYLDGLGVSLGLPASSGYSLETQPTAVPAKSAGGPGTQTTGIINLNSGADPYLMLDPTLEVNGGAGINQLAGYLADGAGAVLPLHAVVQYSPLYLYPR
jgi:hypothetical protein